jgi:hypothetical protein
MIAAAAGKSESVTPTSLHFPTYGDWWGMAHKVARKI